MISAFVGGGEGRARLGGGAVLRRQSQTLRFRILPQSKDPSSFYCSNLLIEKVSYRIVGNC